VAIAVVSNVKTADPQQTEMIRQGIPLAVDLMISVGFASWYLNRRQVYDDPRFLFMPEVSDRSRFLAAVVGVVMLNLSAVTAGSLSMRFFPVLAPLATVFALAGGAAGAVLSSEAVNLYYWCKRERPNPQAAVLLAHQYPSTPASGAPAAALSAAAV
jgi:hypothetical protein